MPENEELTDDLLFNVEEPPGEVLDDDEEETPEAGDESPELSETEEEVDDDALDAAAELRLIKRGKYPKPQAEAPTSPADDEELPDPVMDPQGFYERVKADIRAEMDTANGAVLRPTLVDQTEKNIRSFWEGTGVDFPEEAYAALRAEAESIPLADLRNAASPAFTAQIVETFKKNFKPVPKAAPAKARPVGASVTSGLNTANPSSKSVELKGEDAAAWRDWNETFGDTPESRKRFLKAIGRSK